MKIQIRAFVILFALCVPLSVMAGLRVDPENGIYVIANPEPRDIHFTFSFSYKKTGMTLRQEGVLPAKGKAGIGSTKEITKPLILSQRPLTPQERGPIPKQ